ncbi:Unknown protein [Striga hermonthica]|uniref:Uncharacterized protein n=1 Tax=Striga hermonthica TaxID=68872 RepID=A0A9N7NEJ3_STRHE|nr:Unknown protein [Striga hermonthica]
MLKQVSEGVEGIADMEKVCYETQSPILAPLGVPFCPASVGGSHRTLPATGGGDLSVGTVCDGALLDSHTLRERMDHIAVGMGLAEGVSLDCADVLNHGLDCYMRGLIKFCVDLVGSRSEVEFSRIDVRSKHQDREKLLNGVGPGYQYELQNSRGRSGTPHDKIDGRISLQDFRVAMEMNPRRLGEDWPVLLEKICTRAFEE